MKSLRNRLQIIVAAVICFLMNTFPKKIGKLLSKKNTKSKLQFVNVYSEDAVLYESISCKENMRKINVLPKYKVYWHEPSIKIKGNAPGYQASG